MSQTGQQFNSFNLHHWHTLLLLLAAWRVYELSNLTLLCASVMRSVSAAGSIMTGCQAGVSFKIVDAVSVWAQLRSKLHTPEHLIRCCFRH